MKNKMLAMVAVAMTAAIPMIATAEPSVADKKSKQSRKAALIAQFPDATVDEVQAAIKDGKVTIFDCNGAASYKAGHVPGAVHFATVKKNISKSLPEDKGALVISYCGGPN